ncbi:hypothetical protein CDO87_19465 [Sagittula sp. P11]|uniref:hypothetical protein n=1 Tax=Sagittula sp. P11 TaxID=2009329 RepID=UPI000C2CFAD5|nr:hypothetical protein [Sagittula sp. P11]AUC55207.1 hypothetical protein CDO87_19465 [Sagittula sp. P11]
MWTWILDNAAALSVALNTAMLLVWLAYLQLFLTSIRRSNRAVIHIDMAAGQNEDARCIVTNMGADTVYILGVKVDLDCDGDAREALVTDVLEEDGPLGGDFRERTNQGPLAGGEAMDIGSFHNIVDRAAMRMGEDISLTTCHSVEITVVVAAQQAHRLLGGHKRYDITRENGALRFRSEDILTRQITSGRRRRQLARDIAC